ncbi:MAG: serine/threonine protein kinase [Planctomycetales bacterium]|nr:serine/threonine protein kinase [Planctomycetales bacterium]
MNSEHSGSNSTADLEDAAVPRSPHAPSEARSTTGLDGQAKVENRSDLADTTGLPTRPIEASVNAKTVISHRPVAAPEEFYRAMPLADLAEMLEGRQLDHFAVEQMIGGGGMGAVFRGRDLRLDRVVAIKVIPASKRDAETLRRFRQEAQAAARLDHPNIARVYYVGEAEQWNYIVFEFIDGVNIRDLVELEGPLTVDDAVYYTRQVAEALEHARERDVVHRDIKPSNILVTAIGQVKVVDMGLARDTSMDKSTEDATASGVTLGTFDYISPEQARNPRDADVRSDLYSLGCSLFFMLTGHPPFPDGTALQKLLNHGSQPPPDPRAWRDDITDQLHEILLKLMEKRPIDRYQRPVDVINDLMILADIEGLPRSQSPGTVVLSPTLAQPSLLEANLPWIVSVLFLLGSTLWFSLQSLSTASGSGDFEEAFDSSIRVLSTTDPQAQPSGTSQGIVPTESFRPPSQENGVSSQISTAAESPLIDKSSTESRRSLPFGSSLVVAAERPNDVPASLWDSSLARAIDRYLNDSDIAEIELRGRIQLDRVLNLHRSVLLRGSDQYPATLEFSPRLLTSVEEWSGLLRLQDARLVCDRVSFLIDVPNFLPIGILGLFDLQGASSLDLNRCVVTVKDSLRSESVYVVLASGNSRAGVPIATAEPGLAAINARVDEVSSSLRPEDARVGVIARDSIVRGEATLISFQNSESVNRMELTVENSLVALTGVALDVEVSSNNSTNAGSVRLNCKHSTFINEQGFASVQYPRDGVPTLGFVRNSQDCVYWSKDGEPHLTVHGLARSQDLSGFSFLLLQGQENAYDSRIRNLCVTVADDDRTTAYGFTDAGGWFAERGNEYQVFWQNAVVPKLPLSEINVDDVLVAVGGLFEPGVTKVSTPSL